MPNAMLHKSGSGDPEEQQQQPNANNNNHQYHHQHHDDDALRAQNAGDADSDADADSPAAGKSLNVDDRINGSGRAGGGGGGAGAGAGGVVGGRPALKEHDFVGGVGAGGGSGDEKRATVNGRSEVDFETELRLGPPSEAVAQAPKTRAASYEPKFFNNGHEVSGTPAAFLLPPAKNAGIGMAVVGAGAKRVFSELQGGATRMGLLQLPLPLDAVDGGGKGPLMYPWPPQQQQQQPQPSSSAEQQQQRVVLVSDSTHEVAKRPPLPPSAEFFNKNPSQSQSQSQSQSHNNNHHHGSRVAPVVGWPPIRSFRKNLAPQPKPGTEAQQQQQAAANGSGCGSGNSHAPFAVVNHQQQQQHHHHHQLPHKSFPETMFVKVNMDGVAIGRKIDLKAFDGYAQFSQALEEMFKRFVTAQGNSQKPCDNVASESEQAQSYVFGGGDFVLTYEDNEGDRMLVGDVPWEMFVSTVKRLRIMKSAEAQCLAPRSPLKAQQGQLTQE